VRWSSADRRLPLAAGLTALVVGALTARGRGQRLDRRAYRAINRGRGTVADVAFKAVTELGSIWASAGAAVVLATSGRRRAALDAMGAAGCMWGVGQLLKKIWVRPRPYDALQDARLLIARPRGTSWPSSHPAVLLAFATVAGRDLDLGPGPRSALAALVGIVGWSRVYLGVHYPADVAGGILVGRGVADLWSRAVSPRLAGGAPDRAAAGTVAR
jgi:membrane-associated phospholipid phosphatase